MSLSCSFCGKSQREVDCLVAGPTVYICNECVGLCSEIVDTYRREKATTPPGESVALRIKTSFVPSSVRQAIKDCVREELATLDSKIDELRKELLAHVNQTIEIKVSTDNLCRNASPVSGVVELCVGDEA